MALPGDAATVCLFSGGLDALAGVARVLRSHTMPSVGPNGPMYLVSVETNRPIGAIQRNLVQELRRAFPTMDIRHVCLPAQLDFRSAQGEDGRSARTRGFLFLSVGVVVALGAGVRTLNVFENGVGAINLPFHRGQIGADNSRSVHPTTLVRMAEFANVALEPEIQLNIVNPYLFSTKALMCRELAGDGLADLIPLTVSCDGYPRHVAGLQHCGLCTSCVLRRLSLRAAGLTREDDLTGYRDDVLTHVDLISIQPERLVPIRAMEHQVATLRACFSSRDESSRDWLCLEREYPQLADLVEELASVGSDTREDVRRGLVELYSAYVHEWREFAEAFPAMLFGQRSASSGSDHNYTRA